jgi:hypothetical protein
MYEDTLYACDEDDCPEFIRDPRECLSQTFRTCINPGIGIKEAVILTSDLSRKNLERDFERVETSQGTFYRVYFEIYITLDGSELSAELVCQGEVMGRCTARFR